MALTEPTAGRTINDASQPVRITLAEACKKGDILGYSSGWKRALATAGSVIQGRLVAAEAGAIADVITAYREAYMSGYTGGTPGGWVYVAEGSAYGQTTETAPVTSTDADTIIGVILSATEIVVWPGNREDHVHA